MPRTPRRLGLLDAMILVAAIAIGLAWMRFHAARSGHIDDPNSSEIVRSVKFADRPLRAMSDSLWSWFSLGCPCLITFALGLLVVRLRRPGLKGGRAFLQPGAAACGAVAVALGVEIAHLGVELLRSSEINRFQAKVGWGVRVDWWWSVPFVPDPEVHGIAVVAAWSALLLTRRMRCERSTIDRLGRAVGVLMIVAMLLFWMA